MTRRDRTAAAAAEAGATSAVSAAAVVAGLLVLASCARPGPASFPQGSLVVAEVPAGVRPGAPGRAALDDVYPAGSRVVLVSPPFDTGTRRILSQGLFAAGEPAVSPDGRRLVFSGKAAPGSPWQVWEAFPAEGTPHPLTKEPEGASSPALLPDGTLVAVSPVQARGAGWFPTHPSALVAFPVEGPPRRLSFGASSVADPTVLGDGRILFVSAQPGTDPPRSALFAVNNDGTGVGAYGCQHDGDPAVPIRRPRELYDGRLAFVAVETAPAGTAGAGRAEAILAARPWKSRGPAWPDLSVLVRSIEPSPEGAPILAVSRQGAWSLERAGAPGKPLAPVPPDGFELVEAVPVAPRPRMPLGRLSTVDPKRATGTLVCLDARKSYASGPRVERVRFVTAGPGGPRPLGEVPLVEDGSFLAEVPADVPLGIEALDASGHVVRSFPPSLWVRPGENRGCIGCHEPHGTAPRNRRPLAVKSAPVRLARGA